MKESTVVKAIKERVKELSRRHPIWIVKIHGHAEQKAGLPDLRVVFYGLSLDVETKRDELGQATPIQATVINEIRRAGGRAGVAWNVELFDDLLEELLPLAARFVYCAECHSPNVPRLCVDHVEEPPLKCSACDYDGDVWHNARDQL